MGLLDKAKQVAEQAQAKLDEVQQQFNERSGSGEPQGPAVEHDEYGRPVRDEGATAPPHGDPLGEQPEAALEPAPEHPAAAQPDPAAPAPDQPTPEPPADEPDRSGYEAPRLTGGDPLAG